MARSQVQRITALTVTHDTHGVIGAMPGTLDSLTQNTGEGIKLTLPDKTAERSFRVAAGRVDEDSGHFLAVLLFGAVQAFTEGSDAVTALKAELRDQQVR